MIRIISRIVPALMIAALVLVASCTATKRYGCPDSLSVNYTAGNPVNR